MMPVMPNGTVAVGDIAKSASSPKTVKHLASIAERRARFPKTVRWVPDRPGRTKDPRLGKTYSAREVYETPSGRIVDNRGKAIPGAKTTDELSAEQAYNERWNARYKSIQRASGSGVAKSNIREYPYLPEWVKDGMIPRYARRVLNPTDLYASGRLMVESQAQAEGRRLSRRKKRKLTEAERRFAQGRMMLYSPLGRGSVVTGE